LSVTNERSQNQSPFGHTSIVLAKSTDHPSFIWLRRTPQIADRRLTDMGK
jgi:hypothetical protein